MININVKNVLLITMVAILGIVMSKVILTKYKVKGLSELVQAV